MFFFVGAIYFSSVVMMPLFLQSLAGYDATTAGMVLSMGGFVTLLSLPLVGQLTTRIQARYLVSIGWSLIGMAMILSAMRLNLLVSYEEARLLRVAQSLGLGFLFIPINLAAYSGLPPEKSGSISGLMNFTRNIGSSVGTSMVTTLLYRRASFHQIHLVGRANLFNAGFRDTAETLSARLGGDQAGYAAIYRAVLREAQTLAYVDTYWLLAVSSILMLALATLLKRNDLGAAVQVEAG
jgi:DHA2 family multidrug resistance protein